MFSLSTFRAKSPFIARLRAVMRARRMSPRTEDAYVHYVADFLAWSGWTHPDRLTTQHVTDYLSMLATDRNVAASTQNVAFNSLLFLFRHVLDREFGEVKSKRATRVANVPEILTRDEMRALCSHLRGDWLLLAQIGYGTGLRLMELLRLRVRDCDFGNGIIAVHDGKGGRNRVVPMPKSLAAALTRQAAKVAALHSCDLAAGHGSVWLPHQLAAKYPKASRAVKWQWLFPSREICRAPDGSTRRHHLFPNGFQTALRDAGRAAGIVKRCSPHILRHSHATALLEMGRSIAEVQARLGHKNIQTTLIYLHCVETQSMPSPIDCLCDH